MKIGFHLGFTSSRNLQRPLLDKLGLSPSAAWSPARILKKNYTGLKYEVSTGILYDQSGASRDLPPDSGLGEAPAIDTLGPNSRSCLRFDGSNDRLTSAGKAWTVGDVLSKTDSYVVAVCQIAYSDLTQNASAAYDNHAILTDLSSNLGIYVRQGGILYAYAYDTDDRHQQLTFPDDTPFVVELLLTGGTIQGRINGETWGTPVSVGTVAGNFSTIEFGLGVQYNGIRLKMKLGDVLVFKDANIPNDTTKDKIVEDMMNYWVRANPATIGNTAQRDPNDKDDSTRGNAVDDLWFSSTGNLWKATSVSAPAVWTKQNIASTLPGDLLPDTVFAIGRKCLMSAASNAPWLNGWQDDNHSNTFSLSFSSGSPDLAGLATGIGTNFGRLTKIFNQTQDGKDITLPDDEHNPYIRKSDGALIFDRSSTQSTTDYKGLIIPNTISFNPTATTAFIVARFNITTLSSTLLDLGANVSNRIKLLNPTSNDDQQGSLLLNGRSIGTIETVTALYWFALTPAGGFGGVNEFAQPLNAGYAGVGSPSGGTIGFSAIDALNGFNGEIHAILIASGTAHTEAECAAVRQRFYKMNWGTP